jgi:hypothetical protein
LRSPVGLRAFAVMGDTLPAGCAALISIKTREAVPAYRIRSRKTWGEKCLRYSIDGPARAGFPMS